MAEYGGNRFAAIAEPDGNGGSKRQKKTGATKDNTPILPTLDDDGWETVQRGAQERKPPKILVLRPGKAPLAPASQIRQKKPGTHIASSDTQESQSSSKTQNKGVSHLENYCGVCNLQFHNKVALQSHVKLVPGHENYCNLCKRVFKDRNGLQNHVDNALDHDIFCNLCHSAFNDKWGLQNHFENNRSVDHKFVCMVCLQAFTSHKEKEQHLRTAAKHVRCNTCHRQFRTQTERDEHWVKTTKHKHCLQPGCDFDGPNAASLEKHLREDHFQCPGCQAVFPSGTKLATHMDNCPSIQACDKCKAALPNQEDLKAHQAACFPCPECKHWTDSENEHLKHLTTHGISICKCWICGAQMETYTLLIKHLETGKCPALPDAPTYLLRALGKWYHSTLYMDIDVHAQIRTGRLDVKELLVWIKEGVIQPFVCRADGCLQSFGRFSSLVYHVESGTCEWDLKRLWLDKLEKEVHRRVREAISQG